MKNTISLESISKCIDEKYEILEEECYKNLYYGKFLVCTNIKSCMTFVCSAGIYKVFAVQNENNKWAIIHNGRILINFIINDIVNYFLCYESYFGKKLPGLKKSENVPSEILFLITDNDKFGLFSMSNGLILFPQEKPISLFRYGFQLEDDLYSYDGIFQFNKKMAEYCSHDNRHYTYKTSNNDYFLITDYHGIDDFIPSHRGGIFKLKKIKRSGEEIYAIDDYTFDGHKLKKNGEVIEYKRSEYDDFQYDDEDSWNAMTDGQYGDYPGPGWDFN